jgi:hypothetical protein
MAEILVARMRFAVAMWQRHVLLDMCGRQDLAWDSFELLRSIQLLFPGAESWLLLQCPTWKERTDHDAGESFHVKVRLLDDRGYGLVVQRLLHLRDYREVTASLVANLTAVLSRLES